MGLGHLALILRKRGRQKAEENEALSLSSPDPGPHSEDVGNSQSIFPRLLVAGLADSPRENTLPGDILPD